MSFKIRVEQLNHKDFINSVKKLAGQKLPFKHSWHLKGLIPKLDAAMDSTSEMYSEIIKRNAVLDDEGNLVPMKLKEDIKGPDGEVIRKAGEVIPNSYTPKEDNSHVKVQEETAELMSTELTIDHGQLDVEALSSIEISAEELDMLEPIIMIPKEVSGNVLPMNK